MFRITILVVLAALSLAQANSIRHSSLSPQEEIDPAAASTEQVQDETAKRVARQIGYGSPFDNDTFFIRARDERERIREQHRRFQNQLENEWRRSNSGNGQGLSSRPYYVQDDNGGVSHSSRIEKSSISSKLKTFQKCLK